MSVLLFERRGPIALVTLNRPEARNAVNPELAVRMARAWEEVRDDPEIRVAVLTGAGDKSFCAGADLARLIPLFTGARPPEDEWDEAMQKDTTLSDRALLRDFDPEKPIVAAVTGFCIAGGMEMLQATDIRIASVESRFGLQEPKWGLFPISGSTVRLPRQVPFAVAMEILLTGDLIDAARAYEIGLVNRVLPRDEVVPAALRVAETIAENGPVAVRAIRKSARACMNLSEPEALALERTFGRPVFETEDAREGPRAFREKRKPRFTGR